MTATLSGPTIPHPRTSDATPSPWIRRWALASLIANVGIVITGGAVRLTGSGLGCPTWPKCTDTSYVTTSAMGGHGVIEFGNRVLGGIVGLIAVALLLTVWRHRPRNQCALQLSIYIFLGVVFQGVLGGVTVLTGLNPWTVAAHFLGSMAIIAAAYALWLRVRHPPTPTSVRRSVRNLLATVTGASATVLVLGTLVTGSGPHAGDRDTPRMDFDQAVVAQTHADVVFLLIGLSIGLWFAVPAGAPRRAVSMLLAVQASQAVIGFVQYFAHLPVLVVGLHMAGACAVWLATLAVWPTIRAGELS